MGYFTVQRWNERGVRRAAAEASSDKVEPSADAKREPVTPEDPPAEPEEE